MRSRTYRRSIRPIVAAHFLLRGWQSVGRMRVADVFVRTTAHAAPPWFSRQ